MASQIDESFLPFSFLVDELSSLDGQLSALMEDQIIQVEMQKVEMELPIQLEILIQDGAVIEIGGVPPLNYIDTTIFPVFHQLRLRLEKT